MAEQQLRRGASCVLDVVARGTTRERFAQLAAAYGARFDGIECICTSKSLHRRRVVGRDRGIPGWYELDWAHAEPGRTTYVPLSQPKCVIDAVDDLSTNLGVVRDFLKRPQPEIAAIELVDFEPHDQSAVRQLVLDGLHEHWDEADESLNACGE